MKYRELDEYEREALETFTMIQALDFIKDSGNDQSVLNWAYNHLSMLYDYAYRWGEELTEELLKEQAQFSMEKNMFITYVSDDEVLVTTKKLEAETIKHWFAEGGRDLDSYDRFEMNPMETAIRIQVGWKISTNRSIE